ncbi:glycerophosphoryl diester phosphodiesterase [Balneicella halophila]|uniref:Glycerophosphoryl diester phosphodiesterase n=1 Tax=Balneicella halophila TaxID=1537566 RepID=A0A7L4UQA3_BALHA|nr:glycerophosphodiester phosphodiesterase [Balneicella halophila]PVX51849.1 glycerophosphoryl diester phosphodiesterase [Balneicella halophila]
MRNIIVLFVFVLTLLSCINTHKKQVKSAPKEKYHYDLQGHRGARGLAPENTMPAFEKALELGVKTLELDVVLSKDKQVVVSHEPWFNAILTLTPENEEMQEITPPSTNFYQMDYSNIKEYDCGSRQHPNFPHQKLKRTHKPLLTDVFEVIEKKSLETGKSLHYNIEIKSMPQGDNIYHPEPKEYVDIVLNTIQDRIPNERFNIQSFDFRILQYLHENYPKIAVAALVEKGTLNANLTNLGFTPEIYSPNYTLVDSELVADAHQKGIKVIPWTVNSKKEMLKLLQAGVDGIITDYPDRALEYRE